MHGVYKVQLKHVWDGAYSFGYTHFLYVHACLHESAFENECMHFARVYGLHNQQNKKRNIVILTKKNMCKIVVK